MRDALIKVTQDGFRSVDYLVARSDIAQDKLAFFGTSLGTNQGIKILALEPRFQTAILFSGGLAVGRSVSPESDRFNFVPRIKPPVLMVNGRYDYQFPLETNQLPQFRLLGTPPEHKRYIVVDRGHGARMSAGEIREVLDWLDKYLGAVKR